MSTSKLQKLTGKHLRKHFAKYGIVENSRPGWLISSKGERLELDFFIDKLSLAIEVQGRQHLEFTSRFHQTEYDFTEQLRRDQEKKEICERTNITLMYIYKEADIQYLIADTFKYIEELLSSTDKDDIYNEMYPYKKHVDLISQALSAYNRKNRLSKGGVQIIQHGIRKLLWRDDLSPSEQHILVSAIKLRRKLLKY